MKFISILMILFSKNAFAYFDTGTGANGACTQATIVAGTRTYNCTTLNITVANSVFNAVGGSAVVIKVQGDVTISNTLSANGGVGANANGAGTLSGGLSGAGGSNGGDYGALDTDGQNGNGTGGGVKGLFVNDGTNTFDVYGGGGGGGSYSTQGGTAALNGDINGASQAGTRGAQGSSWGNETLFESSFIGGSGGASGGGGETTGGAQVSGSTGGGGGGAIHIIAGGNISISGSITANGGNGGGDGASVESGGGAGSGGAIWLQAEGNIVISGTLTATGGTGGTNGSFGTSGEGGSGGNGRIRLDDTDGVITGGGSVTPSAQVNSVASVIARNGASSVELTSDISCAAREKLSWNHLVTFLFGCLILISFKFRRAEKFPLRAKF